MIMLYDFIAPALVEYHDNEDVIELIANNAWEFMMGTLSDKEVAELKKHVQRQDPEQFDKLVSCVTLAEDFRPVIEKITKMLIDNLRR